MDNKIYFSITLIGGDSVGKTCFLHRLLTDQFDSTIPSTVGIEHKMKTISIDDQIIEVNLYDTPATYSIEFLSPYIADGLLIFYDITDPITLQELYECISEIGLNMDIKDFPIMLVGTKCDMEDQRKITLQKVAEYAELHSIHLIEECSSVDGTNVNKIFVDIVKEMLKQRLERQKREEEEKRRREEEERNRNQKSFFSNLFSFFKK